MSDQLSKIAGKTLGDSTSYAVFTDTFDSSLLNPMPRKLAREHWGIQGSEFVGYDVWHCHEATFLLDNGCPVAGTLKFVYPSSSEFMVESKSAKLYLNSFDMCRMGGNFEEAVLSYETQIRNDLSACVGADVQVKFHSSGSYSSTIRRNLLGNYADLALTCPGIYSEKFNDYGGLGHYIQTEPGCGETRFFTNALRSRCRHTKQKDTGLAAIYHKSDSAVVIPLSAFKQIVSLREVNEFHEFCAEKIFIEIEEVCRPGDDICVMLLYSRRGSLDINPVRASNFSAIPDDLINVNVLTEKVQGQ